MVTTTIQGKYAQDIYNEITAYMKGHGYNASSWYAGITDDIDERLFGYHNVSRQQGAWIYISAINSDHSRRAESALLEFGCDGGSGGGDNKSVYVYCYLKVTGTRR